MNESGTARLNLDRQVNLGSIKSPFQAEIRRRNFFFCIFSDFGVKLKLEETDFFYI